MGKRCLNSLTAIPKTAERKRSIEPTEERPFPPHVYQCRCGKWLKSTSAGFGRQHRYPNHNVPQPEGK